MLDGEDIVKLSEVFATKDDLKELEEKFATKEDFNDFKDNSLSKLDEILDGLKTLKDEKIIHDAQDKRQKKVLEIHNNVLKSGKILSEDQASQIAKLRVF